MKFGVREICDVVFKATDTVTIGSQTFSAGDPVLYIDTAKTSTLEGAATTVYATGGKGNARLLAWEGEKTLTFTVEDAMLSPLGFSVLTGAGVFEASAGEPINVHTTIEVIAGAAGAVVIDAAALGLTGAEEVQVLVGAGSPGIYGTTLDLAGAVSSYLGTADTGADTGVVNSTTDITLTFDTPPAEGDRVRLDFYIEMESGVTELQIDAGTFAGYYYVEASTLFRNQATGKDLPAEFIIPKAKIQSNFTFSMASTGDPSTFSFVMDAFPAPTKFSNEDVLCAIQVIDSTPVG